jgi:hypothetical protein
MNSKSYSEKLSEDNIREFKTMLARFLATIQDKLETNNKIIMDKLEKKIFQNIFETNNKSEENNDKLRSEIEIKLDNSQDVKIEASEVDSNLERIDNKSTNLDRNIDVNKENSDVVLRWQGECVEQMQLQIHQKKLAIEDRFEKLHSQLDESRELTSIQSNDDTVPCTLKPNGASPFLLLFEGSALDVYVDLLLRQLFSNHCHSSLLKTSTT